MAVKPVDDELIQLFRDRSGTRTDVTLKNGRVLAVFNVAWGYDINDPYAHISANVSRSIEGHTFEFFFTHEVANVADQETGTILWQP